MEFRLENNPKGKIGEYGVPCSGLDYSANSSGKRVDDLIRFLSEKITDEEYHELCHQLYGQKSEFNKVDGEFEDGLMEMDLKKYRTVKASLYRGIFWSVMHALDEIDIEAEEEKEEN